MILMRKMTRKGDYVLVNCFFMEVCGYRGGGGMHLNGF